MSSLTLMIVALFVIGYFFIAIESVTKVNKAAIALLMFVVCWTLFMFDPSQYLPTAIGENVGSVVSEVMEKHLGSTSTTLFFLMGAMTIVELVDQNGGFNFVRNTLKTKSKKALLWRQKARYERLALGHALGVFTTWMNGTIAAWLR